MQENLKNADTTELLKTLIRAKGPDATVEIDKGTKEEIISILAKRGITKESAKQEQI